MRGLLRFFGSRKFWHDTRGVAWIYVTITASALFGFAALVIDFTRVDITHTQARSAAEAVAIAGASQLDGTSDAITRALNAALNTPLVQNEQNLGATPGNITIANIRFLKGLPAGDPTLPDNPSVLDPYVVADQSWTSSSAPDAPYKARFIEVTTQQITVNNAFIQVLGGGSTAVTRASAVAGFTQVLCRRSPLAICNPMEDPNAPYGTPAPAMDISAWKGRQVLIKGAGSGAGWTPGAFSLVDIDGTQSAKKIYQALAEDEPDLCVNAVINIKPGQVQGIRNALNTRFDMYENPVPGGLNPKTNPKMYPAPDVVKGKILSDPTDKCSFVDNNDPTVASMRLPRDQESRAKETDLFSSGEPSNSKRFGNGVWDCAGYWNRMHGGPPPLPDLSGCTSTASAATGATRQQIYQYEIAHGIPNNAPAGENGDTALGKCYTGTGTPIPSVDRREVYFAVINCIELGPISGTSSGDLPVEAFIKGFLTEPVGDPGGSGGSDPEIWLEIVDIARPGGEDGVLHDIVQLYR